LIGDKNKMFLKFSFSPSRKQLIISMRLITAKKEQQQGMRGKVRKDERRLLVALKLKLCLMKMKEKFRD
jgi:hypothetical protein